MSELGNKEPQMDTDEHGYTQITTDVHGYEFEQSVLIRVQIRVYLCQKKELENAKSKTKTL